MSDKDTLAKEIQERFIKLVSYAENIETTLQLVRNELKSGKKILSDESKQKLIKMCDKALKNE